MSEPRKVPSAEDFARAKRLMRERFEHLDAVESAILTRFLHEANLYRVFVLPQIDVDFRIYVFFAKNSDVAESEQNGVQQAIIDFAEEAIERVGRGKVGVTKFAFVFDSDEDVLAKCDGSYYHRLH